MSDEPFSFDDEMQKQLDPHFWAKRKASELFMELRKTLGDAKARQIFKIWAEPPSAHKLNEIENKSIIDRLDMMPGGPNVKELARQMALEKYSNPTSDQIAGVERQIRRLNAIRKKNPFWPQQVG